jgi:hypothetical protein
MIKLMQHLKATAAGPSSDAGGGDDDGGFGFGDLGDDDDDNKRENRVLHTHARTQHCTLHSIAHASSTAQHSTAQHSTAQHSTAQHSTAQHSTAQHTHPAPCLDFFHSLTDTFFWRALVCARACFVFGVRSYACFVRYRAHYLSSDRTKSPACRATAGDAEAGKDEEEQLGPDEYWEEVEVDEHGNPIEETARPVSY